MVRTRFAPSPTGFLHIGGVRTALFNWLFARRHGGQFLLRIDDTDAERNVEAALAPILHGFRWLGIDWDEGPEVGGPYAPYYQSQRSAQYQAAVDRLLAGGFAYRDYASTEEIQAERQAAEAEKRPFVYSRKWMAETTADEERFSSQGRQGVVRLKMPREGKLVIADLVRGNVEFDWAREQDHVIQRADGTCLYHLANVVDDRDFEITHVIRAEEHLSNTPRQIFIAQSLGYELPAYAHLPYVAEPGSKNKLSKRKLDKYLKNRDFAQVNQHGQAIAKALGLATTAETFNPVIVDFYEQVGYLPDAIINYLMLLGWSLDDKTEFLTRQQMIDNFSLERVTKAPASFDPKKLLSFQDHYMQEVPLKQKVSRCLDYLQQAKIIPTPTPCEMGPKLTQIIKAAGDRIKVFGDILDYTYFFVPDDKVEFDADAFEKRIGTTQSAALLSAFRDMLIRARSNDDTDFKASVLRLARDRDSSLGQVTDSRLLQQIASLDSMHSFDSDSIERSHMPRFLRAQAVHLSEVIHSIRVSVTGKSTGPGLFQCLEILGRESCIRRIEYALARANKGPFPNFLSHLPHAISSPYRVDAKSKPIKLYNGKLKLKYDGSAFDATGRVRCILMPHPAIHFNATVKNGIPSIGESYIALANNEPTFHEAITTNAKVSSDSTKVSGILHGAIEFGDASVVRSVIFNLTNFHDFIGEGIASSYSAYAGRLSLISKEWAVVLDADPDTPKRIEFAREQGGTAITHVGRIQRCDGDAFKSGEINEALSLLQSYLSLLRGFWVAPLISVGYDDTGACRWEDWTVRRSDDWQHVMSVCPVHEMEHVAKSFASFADLWKQVGSQDVLRTSLYWYLNSNRGGAVDSAIVTTQIALESISNSILFESPSVESVDNTVLRVERALQSINVKLSVPPQMQELVEYAKRSKIDSGPALLRQLRNMLAHPHQYSSGSRQYNSSTLREAWDLGLWYCELLLLYCVGYTGRYQSRLHSRFVGETESVPWELPDRANT